MQHARQAQVFAVACWAALVVSLVPTSQGQELNRRSTASSVLTALEDKIFLEINLLRTDPDDYATQVVVPMKERLVRFPKDSEQPFEEFRAYLSGGTRIDYFSLDEGGAEETARAVIDETVEALRAAPKLARLERNEVLDRSARFYSQDFLKGGQKRDPHTDSLGRKSGPRIASFGTSRESIADWQRFVDRLENDSKTVARVFSMKDRFYWLVYSGTTGYQYWSVPRSLGEFIVKHGKETTLARIDKPGYECPITVDQKTRMLRHGEDQVPYPFLLPVYGENVTWGNWSPAMAARGMVCWWLLDPGILDRGHRKLLLDADFKFAGVGCARSRSVGWVATLDVCGEELVKFPAE